MTPVLVSGTLGLIALAVIATPCAMANESGWFGGVGVGRAKSKIDDARIAQRLLGTGLTMASISSDEHDTGYKLFGGYQFNRYLAVEAGYFDLGKFSFSAATLPPRTLSGELKVKGLNLDAVGFLPFTEKFSAMARVGMNYAETKDSFSGTGLVGVANRNPSRRETNYKAGLGVQYKFTDSVGMRLEAERYRINDAVGNRGDVDLVSVGLVYWFGGNRQSAAPRAAAPEPVAVAPAPAPLALAPEPPPPPPPAPPPPRTRVNFSADSLFEFGKFTLTPAGQQALDRLVGELRSTDYDVITVTGHTDRIGSHDRNMTLSTRRAEAVANYLVTSAGIPAEKIVAKGTDGSDPVTKPGECKGKKATKTLIACLQPDRRVEVEVTGTRAAR